MKENERMAGANSVGDDRIFRNGMKENERKYRIKYLSFVGISLKKCIYERVAGANSVGDDRIFRNGMTENEGSVSSILI
jgi:hypothetical protein